MQTTKWFALGLLAAVLNHISLGQNPTTSELLQKGIYLQETVGDLDGAIKIYRQVVQRAGESRANAAQAEYRLGACLREKGQQAEAAGAFQDLISDYPEQTDMVSKARALVSRPLELLPAPWTDGEILEYTTVKEPGSQGFQTWYSLQSSKAGAGRWVLDERRGLHDFKRVEFDPGTMQPLDALQLSGQNSSQTRYQGQAAQIIDDGGKRVAQVVLAGAVFDENELPMVLRRLPWAENYKTSLSLLDTRLGRAIDYEFSVKELENIQTPAGEFPCYRIEARSLTFWISADSRRLIVKSKRGDYATELSVLPRTGAGESIYRDEETGASVKVPAGWILDRYPSKKPHIFIATMIDLHSSATVFLDIAPCDDACGQNNTPGKVQATAEKLATGTQYTSVRPGSIQARTVGGHPAASWIEDFPALSEVHYKILVQSASWQAFNVLSTNSNEFKLLRSTLDIIMDGLVIK